jgi:hypothetical protein
MGLRFDQAGLSCASLPEARVDHDDRGDSPREGPRSSSTSSSDLAGREILF